MRSTSSYSVRGSSRYGHARRTRAKSSSSPYSPRADFGHDLLGEHVERLHRDVRARSSSPARTASSSAVHSTSSSRRQREQRGPSARRPPHGSRARRAAGTSRWRAASRAGTPARRRRCRCRARAKPWPRARAAEPAFSRCSASRRCSRDRLPWCAATCSAPMRSLRCRVTRSTMRRVLAKISVV